MKKILYILLALFIFTSCEDTVDVDLVDEEPRLIIDALIRVDLDSPNTRLEIKASLTSSFFGEVLPTSEVNQMFILNENTGTVIALAEIDENRPGVYMPIPDSNTPPELIGLVGTAFLADGDDLLLTFNFREESFLARTSFVPAIPINSVTQGDDFIFDEDDTEVIIDITDVADREDFYVFDFGFGEFLTVEDQFFDGQEFQFSYFYDGDDFDFQPGQELEISILGADEPFYTYMEQLIEQSDLSGNPFQVPVSTVRGNILNTDGIDNIDIFDNVDRPNSFALGYFAIVQEFKSTLVLE